MKLDDKIKKDISIIDKLNIWKKDILSLVDNIIENINCEIMIYKMIIKNFKWKYLDYMNYLNYNEVLSNFDKINSKLENFMNSKTLIEETNILTDYLFEKFEKNIEINKEKKVKNIFSIINDNDEKEINNLDEKEKLIDVNDIIENNSSNYNGDNINITEILNKGNALLCGKKYIYSCSLDSNELKQMHEFKDIENDKNKINDLLMNDNEIIFKNIINLKRSLSNKYKDYNILLWKIENDLKKDNLLNLINNKKKENEENKSSRIKEEEKEKDEESKKSENQNINNNNERNNLNQFNNNNINISTESSNGCLLINNNNNYENNNNIFNYRNNNNIFKNSTYDSSNIFSSNNYNKLYFTSFDRKCK